MEEHQTSQNCSRLRGQLTLRVHAAALISPSCAGLIANLSVVMPRFKRGIQ